MAFSGWRKSGSNALLSKDGKGYWCEQCPCGDCWRTLREAIYERQIVNTLRATNATIDVDYTHYSIGEYQMFMSGFANYYYNFATFDPENCPSTGNESLMTASLVYSCLTCSELLALIKNMRYSREPVSSGFSSWVRNSGSAVYKESSPWGYPYSCAQIKSMVEAMAWPSPWTGAVVPYAIADLFQSTYDTGYSASLRAIQSYQTLADLSTFRPKTVHFTARYGAPSGYYSVFGYPDNVVYDCPEGKPEGIDFVLSTVTDAGASASSSLCPAIFPDRPTWPSCPPEQSGLYYARGWQVVWWRPVIDWNFEIKNEDI